MPDRNLSVQRGMLLLKCMASFAPGVTQRHIERWVTTHCELALGNTALLAKRLALIALYFHQSAKLTATDERHLCRHHCHELHVCIQWQFRHVSHCIGDVLNIYRRFGCGRAIGLWNATAHS